MFKLGRRAVKTDSRTLKMARYLTPALPAPPPAVDWTKGVTNFGMMLNDQIGCCTIAGIGHAIQIWTANTGALFTIPDPTILYYYETWDGYKLGNPNTDNGGIELDVLNKWRQQGFGGHALTAFADPNVKNLGEVRQAINLFGGVYIGIGLPLTAQGQHVWDVVPKAGDDADKDSWGGHCVFVPAYDEDGFTCITWGQKQRMTLAFWNAYCDEAHALLSSDWISATGLDPQNFNLSQLQADLALIR